MTRGPLFVERCVCVRAQTAKLTLLVVERPREEADGDCNEKKRKHSRVSEAIACAVSSFRWGTS